MQLSSDFQGLDLTAVARLSYLVKCKQSSKQHVQIGIILMLTKRSAASFEAVS